MIVVIFLQCVDLFAESTLFKPPILASLPYSNLWLLLAGAALVIAFVLFYLSNRKLKLIQEQKQTLEEAFEELNQTNEEILSQRDQIDTHRNEVLQKNQELFNKNAQISDSINYAKRLQTAVLANERKLKDYLDCFLYSAPKEIVSGDFCWIQKQWDLVYFGVVDCTGHGVPGALMSLVCNRILDDTLEDFKFEDPAMILSNAHEQIMKDLGQEVDGYLIRDGMDISLLIYDEEEKELRFSGAHNSVVMISEGKITRLEADNYSVGFSFKNEKQRTFTTHSVEVNKGDMVYLFTDGMTDQFGGPRGLKLFYQNFEAILLNIWTLPLSEQHDRIQEEFENWKGKFEQMDDVTVMGVRF